MATLQLPTDNCLARSINAMHLEDRLGDVETDCRDRLHDLAPPNRGTSAGTHIHGTHVPVEEPSTASKADTDWALAGESDLFDIQVSVDGGGAQARTSTHLPGNNYSLVHLGGLMIFAAHSLCVPPSRH